MSLFKPICKFCATISHVREIAPVLRQALQEAQSGTPGIRLAYQSALRKVILITMFPGPVFVEFPIDVLYKYAVVAKEIGMKDNSKSLGQKVVNW